MKSLEDIDYEIAFIETELEANEFVYLSKDQLTGWLSALNWVKSKWNYERKTNDITK